MKITKEWLRKRGACHKSLDYVCSNNYIGLDIIPFLQKLIKENRLFDANWLITKGMNKKQNVSYAIFAAEQVINIFEKKFPTDKRPRKAIESAKNYLKNPCEKTKSNAAAAAHAAETTGIAASYAAARATYAADAEAAANAAYAAYTASYAASTASSYTSHAAARASFTAAVHTVNAYAASYASHAADAAADAAYARKKMRIH